MKFQVFLSHFLVLLAGAAFLGIWAGLGSFYVGLAAFLFALFLIFLVVKAPSLWRKAVLLVFGFSFFYMWTTYQLHLHKQDVLSWVSNVSNYETFVKDQTRTGRPISMKFVVLDTVFASNQTSVLVRSLSDHRVVSLQLSEVLMPLHYGDVISVEGFWTYPHLPRNPGVSDTTKRYLYAGISGRVYPKHVKKVGHVTLNPIKNFALYLKGKVLKQHQQTLPYPYSDLLTSFIFGESGTVLPDSISEQFQRTGMTHVLVVSGAQVTLLCGIVFQILRQCGIQGGFATGIMSGVCVVFYFLSGGGTSVLRAVIMTMTALVFQLRYYRISIVHVIALTFLGMALVDPFVVADIGAQLSFMATVSLVFGAKVLEDVFPNRWPSWLRSGLAVSISPFLFTTPIVLYHFHRVSVVSIAVNFVSMQLVEWVVVFGFFSTAFGFLSVYLASVLNHGLYYLLWMLNVCTHWVSKWQLSVIHIPSGLGFVVLWYGFLFLILFGTLLQVRKSLELAKRVWKFTIITCFVCFVGSFIWGFTHVDKLRVIHIDVGQGDSSLILTPKGHAVLIDAGPKEFRKNGVLDAGERAVLPVLHYYGVNTLDLVILTHFHLDHYGGLSYVLNHVPVDKLWDNSRFEKAPKDYVRFVSENPTKRIPARPGVLSFDDGVTLRCFYPFGDVSKTTENNASVVVKVSFGDMDFMFTGDLEKAGEAVLVSEYGTLLESEVLKLGHHGSRTSSTAEFLAYVNPQCGVVSAGRNNKYRHPSLEVIERLQERHIQIYRTDTQGAILFETDGKQIHAKTFLN